MSILRYGIIDIINSFRKYDLIRMLGRQYMVLRYRRSKLGPFWITISMGIQILTLGLIFGQLFDASIHKFFHFLAIGIILWNYITAIISEGSTSFISSTGMITQLELPIAFYFFCRVWTSFLFLLHNAVIIPFVFIVMWYSLSWKAVLAVPGFLLLTVNVSWMGMVSAIFCTRFRDFPQLITSVLQIFFYVTPIMWMPELMPQRVGRLLLDMNPFHHLISVVRDPILGIIPGLENYLICCIMAIAGWIGTTIFLGRYRDRIAYWL